MFAFIQNYSLKEIVGFLAGIFSAVACIPYIISILRNKTKPSRSSWWIWSLVGLIIVFSYYFVGALNTIWVPIVLFIFSLIIAILSLWYGEGSNFSLLDKACLLSTVISIIFWAIFESAMIVLIINIFIDFLGFIPTFKKTFQHPHEESGVTWILFFISSILNFIAIDHFVFSIASYPIYMLIMDFIMLVLIFRREGKIRVILTSWNKF